KFNDIPNTDVALLSHVPVNNPVSFELAALNRLMEKTISEHDESLWLQFYSDDGSFMYSRTPMVKGKSELAAFLNHHVKGLPVFEKLDVRNDHIDDLGNYVIEYASHIAIVRSGDFSGVFTGKDLAIWRREKNGSLKIHRHIGMYD
ncbi:MAG TPA: nuclear transport factor 2 family protein, partial [Cyclobacteriaceae bacterium]